MNKVILFGAGSVVVAAAIVGGVLLVTNSNSDSDASSHEITTTSTSSSGSFKASTKKACDILTQQVADSILGPGSIKGDTSAGDIENDTVSVSNCVYGTADHLSAVSILARVAKNQTQADADAQPFEGKTNIPGYGDKAYWSADYGQFNILSNNNWYILSAGPVKMSERTQAQGQQFADAIKANL